MITDKGIAERTDGTECVDGYRGQGSPSLMRSHIH